MLKYNYAKMRIYQLIAERHLEIGSCIPPERELQEQFGLSMITIRRAMKELEEEHIIVRRPRVGTFLHQDLSNVPDLGTILFLRLYREACSTDFLMMSLIQETEGLLKQRHLKMVYRVAQHPDLELAECASNCMGIIVTGWISDAWRDFISSFNIPVMVLGINPYPERFSSVSYDMELAAFQCYEALQKEGCRKIALLNGERHYQPAVAIHRGVLAAVRASGESADCLPTLWASQANMKKCLTEFLHKHPDLDGMILESGELDSLLGCLWQMHYRRDVKIALIVDNKDVIRPFSTIPQGIAAYFTESLPFLGVKRMVENLSEGSHRITCDRLQPHLFYQDENHMMSAKILSEEEIVE